MKFTLNWLKRHLDTKASAQEIGEKLTAIGLELESFEDKAAALMPFKVAYVESAEPHPNADRLKICMVKTDNGTVQVVCGGPNAKAGMKGIFAPEGSVIPQSGVMLKKGVIRGVESCGMLVSEGEMGLPPIPGNIIIEVDQKYEIGTPFAEIYGLNDVVFEINLTPNRADCAGVRGIARDLAAAGLGKLKPLSPPYPPASGGAETAQAVSGGRFKSPINVKIEDRDGCPLFLGRYIKGVQNGPSPAWLQDLLKSIGLRPISALVDITNFMSVDTCRPLHVFDADKIKGHLLVKKTVKGEKLDALTGKTYETSDAVVGVYDDSGLIDFGGMMGGISTCIDDKTTNVYVESAYFNPARISRAGRDMQLISDARYRFERGVDPEFTATGMDIATALILELCGGEASDIVQAGDVPDITRSIDYDPAYLQQRIGVDLDAKEQKKILEALGFEVSGGKNFKIKTPSWRNDVEGRADITEEIIRIHGFDKIPSVSVHSETSVAQSAETPTLTRTRKARTALAARGMNECVTWSFMGRAQAQMFGLNDNKTLEALTLKNPISSELDVMRPSILPNLIAAAGRNHALGYPDVALCEVGPVFRSTKPEGQPIVAAGVRAGANADRHWADENAARVVDAFDAKADALAALEACGAPAGNAQISRDAPDYFHPGRSGTIRLGPNVLASFGEIHPAVLDEMGINTAVVGFEVFLQNIPEARKKSGTEKTFLKLEPLMPLHRDFAFLVDAKIEADAIIKAALSADKILLKEAQVFDIYTGKGVEDGKKSVALTVMIQPRDQSLTDPEIEALSKKIIDAVIAKTGGTLRQ